MSALDDFLNDDEEFLEGSTFHDLGEKYYYGVKEAAAELQRLRAIEAAATKVIDNISEFGEITGSEYIDALAAALQKGE
jgi:hypothetical protein